MSTETNTAQVLPRLSAELSIPAGQVAAVAKLLKEGNTIPFIARYRKEVHGNLDEVQISKIQERPSRASSRTSCARRSSPAW